MKFIEQLTTALRGTPEDGTRAELRESLDAGQQAKYSENYETARARFNELALQADNLQDMLAAVIAKTNDADILIRMERADDALRELQALLPRAENDSQRAYLHIAMGKAYEALDNIPEARISYERGRDLARSARNASAQGRALGHLASLALIDGSSAYAVHLLREALPLLSTANDLEASCHFTGLLGQALVDTGAALEGRQMLERASQIAAGMGYRLYERRWAITLAEMAQREGRYLDARAHYTHALHAFAPETVTAEYIRAVRGMAEASLAVRETDDALAYAQIAVRTAERLGDAAILASAHGALGTALHAANRHDEAIQHLRAAAEAGSSRALRALAAALNAAGNHAEAVELYQQAAQHAQSNQIPLEVAGAKRDLGLAHFTRGDLNAAIAAWAAALNIYVEQGAHAQAARLYVDIGSARRALGQRSRAIREYEQALVLLNKLDEADFVTRGVIVSNAAVAYAEHGDADSADAFFNEAISLAERAGDRTAEATRCGNYGWFLLLVGRPRRALSMLERALMLSEKLNLALPAAVQTDNIGLVHEALYDLPQAITYHQRALTMTHDPYWTAQFRINLANALITHDEEGSADEARDLLALALATARELDNAELLAAAQTTAARLALARHNTSEAGAMIEEALAAARHIDNRRLVAEALSLRSQQQALSGNEAAATATWREAQRLYSMLRMPQAKLQPTWLATTT